MRSMLERLGLKNVAECTSQRLKWTSGARDMILVFRIYSIFLTLQNSFIRRPSRRAGVHCHRKI